MALLIPEITEAELRTWVSRRGEAAVYRAARTLDSSLVVIHGLETVGAGLGGTPRDGEADFVILDPAKGILIIEVKGGGGEYDSQTNQWTSRNASGTHRVKDPFKQAEDRKHDIRKILEADSRFFALGIQQLWIGHAVLFPDLDDLTPVTRPNAPPAIRGGRREVANLKGWLNSVFDYWAGASKRPERLGEAGVAAVRKSLCASFSVQPTLASRIQQGEDAIRYWTNDQWQALQGTRRQRRVSVAGGAGTGKTLLALRRAQELAQSGKKTLFLCYNVELAEFLKKQNLEFVRTGAATTQTLQTFTFHQFCGSWTKTVLEQSGRDCVREAEIAFPGQDQFAVQLPIALGYALDELDPGFEAIVIDEGQDMGDEFWLPIGVMADGATLAVFHDPNQAVFRRSIEFPFKADQDYELFRNCRNTDPIHEAAYRYYQGPLVEARGLTGSPVLFWEEDDRQKQAGKIAAGLHRFIHHEMIQPAQIAVLLLDQFTKSGAYQALELEAKARQIPLARESRRTSASVLLDTVARFKGLESSVVVVWLNTLVDPEKYQPLLYVALSRPKTVLVLAGTREDCKRAVAGTG